MGAPTFRQAQTYGDVRIASPGDEVIDGAHLHGAAFYLSVALRAPLTVGGEEEPGGRLA